MPTSKRIPRLLALSFGLLGLIGCSLAFVGVWSLGRRLGQATEEFFEKVESTAVVVQARVVQMQKRFKASRVTTERMAQRLKDWTTQEAVERVALRLDAEEKTERLASMLQQADHWLEISGSSVELMRRALSMASSAGAPADPRRARRAHRGGSIPANEVGRSHAFRDSYPRLHGREERCETTRSAHETSRGVGRACGGNAGHNQFPLGQIRRPIVPDAGELAGVESQDAPPDLAWRHRCYAARPVDGRRSSGVISLRLARPGPRSNRGEAPFVCIVTASVVHGIAPPSVGRGRRLPGSGQPLWTRPKVRGLKMESIKPCDKTRHAPGFRRGTHAFCQVRSRRSLY